MRRWVFANGSGIIGLIAEVGKTVACPGNASRKSENKKTLRDLQLLNSFPQLCFGKNSVIALDALLGVDFLKRLDQTDSAFFLLLSNITLENRYAVV
jgi:hypothetical protein